MNSNSLDRRQVECLFARVRSDLHYFNRLEGRMHQKHFPADDPVYIAVKRARAAVQELSIQLHRLLVRE